MDSDLEGKNILFYSEHDDLSKEILGILEKSPLLKEQFYKFSVNDRRIRIPNMIREAGIIPVIAVSGFNDLMKGPQALEWIKNNSLSSTQGSGFEYVDISKAGQLSSSFSSLVDTFKASSASQNHNSEFNKGTDYADTTCYASVGSVSHIDTYDEVGPKKSYKEQELERKLNQFKNSRQNDIKSVNNQITNDINSYKEQNPAFAQPVQQPVQQQVRYQPPGAENPALKQQREAQFQNFLQQQPAMKSYENERQFQNVYGNQLSPVDFRQPAPTHGRQYNPGPSYNHPQSVSYGQNMQGARGPVVSQSSNNVRQKGSFPSFNDTGMQPYNASSNSSFASW
ncbi:hypothetical protein N9064_00805 [bacterium]|nr:hypothetical protein [bacterium]